MNKKILFTLLPWLSIVLFAQPQEIVTQKVEAIMVENRQIPMALYYQNANGGYEAFSYGIKRRGSANIQVLNSKFTLYQKTLNEEGEEIMKPMINIPIPAQPEVTIILYGDSNEQFQYLALDNDPKKYPAGSARVINVTSDRAICHIAGQNYPIQPNGEIVVSDFLKDSKDFSFGYFVDTENRTRTTADIKRLRMGHKLMRFLSVIAYETYEEAGAEAVRKPIDIRLYDIVKPEKPSI